MEPVRYPCDLSVDMSQGDMIEGGEEMGVSGKLSLRLWGVIDVIDN